MAVRVIDMRNFLAISFVILLTYIGGSMITYAVGFAWVLWKYLSAKTAVVLLVAFLLGAVIVGIGVWLALKLEDSIEIQST